MMIPTTSQRQVDRSNDNLELIKLIRVFLILVT
jgi:hypothetical protein